MWASLGDRDSAYHTTSVLSCLFVCGQSLCLFQTVSFLRMRIVYVLYHRPDHIT